MANFVYNEGAESLQNGAIVWASDTIQARLIASSATPNKDDDDMATGYTAIGTDQTLGSKTLAKNDSTDRVVYDAANPTWTAVAGGSTVGWVIVFKNDGGNNVPIFALDVADTATNGSDIEVQFDAGGIAYTQQ